MALEIEYLRFGTKIKDNSTGNIYILDNFFQQDNFNKTIFLELNCGLKNIVINNNEHSFENLVIIPKSENKTLAQNFTVENEIKYFEIKEVE